MTGCAKCGSHYHESDMYKIDGDKFLCATCFRSVEQKRRQHKRIGT